MKNIYSELFSKLKYINPNDINKPIEELREIIKPLLVEYFYKFNKSNKINEYFKNIENFLKNSNYIKKYYSFFYIKQFSLFLYYKRYNKLIIINTY